MPHNHEMWAVIGVYTGREDNIFWRRIPGARTASSKQPAQGHYVRGMRSPSDTISFIP